VSARQEMYAPKVTYSCDDPSCCDNGCPIVTCCHCGREWPCPDYVASHSEAQVNAQRRWVTRVWWRPDAEMIRWTYRSEGIEAPR